MHIRGLQYWVKALGAMVLCGCVDAKGFDEELAKHEEQVKAEEQENGEEENASHYTVTFPRPSSTFVLGATALVPYDFRYSQGGSLDMNHLGVPRPIRFELTDSVGEKVGFPVPPITFGPPSPLAPEERFATAPNETIQLNLYLNQMFQIETAGQYVLSAWSFEQKLAEMNIVFAAEPDGDPLVVTEYCTHGLERDDGGATVQCSIHVGPPGTDAPDDSPWILHIESDIQAGDASIQPMSPLGMEVRPHTQVVTAVLDYRWQLWMLLECGEEQSLVVVLLNNCAVRTLVPWSEEELRLGLTRIRSVWHARIALGGVVGEPLYSTERVFAGLYNPPCTTQGDTEETGE